MTDSSENQKIENRVVRCVAFLLAVSVAAIGAAIFVAAIWNVFINLDARGKILEEHFGAIIGMPVAAALAFLLVVFLRQTEGQIVFKGLGFEFNAASGQIATWIVCFLAIAGAIKWLW